MPLRVLFVDDEKAILRSIQREFSADYDVTTAYSAAEATTLLGGGRSFDVIVSDVSMPGLNGLDFIEGIAPRHPLTRFVVLTGNSDAETLRRAEGMESVSSVLRKPSRRDAILRAIVDAAAA